MASGSDRAGRRHGATVAACLAACLSGAATAQPATLRAGSYVVDGGGYRIDIDRQGDRLVVTEPNRRSVYARAADGSFRFDDPAAGTVYGLRIVDDHTVEAFRPGVANAPPTRLSRIDTLPEPSAVRSLPASGTAVELVPLPPSTPAAVNAPATVPPAAIPPDTPVDAAQAAIEAADRKRLRQLNVAAAARATAEADQRAEERRAYEAKRAEAQAAQAQYARDQVAYEAEAARARAAAETYRQQLDAYRRAGGKPLPQ